MELDDLKKNWQKDIELPKSIHTSIMEQLQNKTYGPVATLKAKYLRQLAGLAIIVPLFIYEVIADPLLNNIMGLLPLLFFFLLLAFHGFYNYRILRSLQLPGLPVAATIESQVKKLERANYYFNIVNLALLVLLPVVLEIVMHYRLVPAFAPWHQVAVLWRILIYVGSGVLLYNFDLYHSHYRIGRHLKNLKLLSHQLSE
jgi:hypothetical protein